MQDLQAIKAAQSLIETEADSDYPEPDTIPKTIEELHEICRKLAEACKSVAKDLDRVREGQSKDVGDALQPVGETILHLAGQLSDLSGKLENLGEKLLKNAEHLQTEQKFPPELKAKTDTQGRRLEGIGGKLKTIGKNVCSVGSKFESIGGRVDGEHGNKLTETGTQLKATCEPIKIKGDAVAADGIKLQRLEPREYNNYKENADKIVALLKAIQSILDLLTEMQQVFLLTKILNFYFKKYLICSLKNI